MGFRKHRETDLERELRAQRPQPRDEFVRMLTGHSAAPKARRSLGSRPALPRIVLVAAITVVLAASLGVAGALGHATSSFKSLGTSVYHIVQTPQPSHTNGGNDGKSNDKGGKGNNGGSGNGDPGDDRDHDGRIPFHHEYHHLLPICHDGQVQYVPVVLYLPLLFSHGRHYWVPLSFNPPRCT